MRTLVAIPNADLRSLLFPDRVIEKFSSFSELAFAPVDRPFGSIELSDMIGDCDFCVTSWGSPRFTPEVLARAGRLKVIGHAAGTVVPILDRAAFDLPIRVTSANKLMALSTAECTVALMLAGSWNFRQFAIGAGNGSWPKQAGDRVMGLHGRTVGLIGLGDISRHVIRLLQGFETRLLLCSRYCSPEEAAALGVELRTLEELLEESDMVSLHNTWTPSTEGMIGREQLALLRDGALVVNTARAAIVQEQALLDEVRSGRLTAALDVFHREPLPPDSEWARLAGVIGLPHIGAYQERCKSGMADYIADELQRFVNGEPLRGEVTAEQFARSTPH